MAIFVRFSNGDLAHQMTLERKTARRIKVVVSSSIDKLVKEFLRYLYRCGNGAIPPISPKTTKNDQTLEPPGGRTVRLRYVGVSFTRKFLSSLVQWRRSCSQISDRTTARLRPVWVPRKIWTSVRPEVEIGDGVPLTVWYHERFPIDPENIGSLAHPVPEIFWRNLFFGYEGAAWRRCRKSEICLAVLKRPTCYVDLREDVSKFRRQVLRSGSAPSKTWKE